MESDQYSTGKQTQIESWSCGAKGIFGGHTKRGTDKQTDTQRQKLTGVSIELLRK